MVQFVQGFVRVCLLVWEYWCATYFYHSMPVTSGLRHYVFLVVCPSLIMNVKFETNINFDSGWSTVNSHFHKEFESVFYFFFCLMTDIVHSSSPPQLFLILGFRYLLVHHVMKPSISPLYSSVKIVLSDDSMFPTGNDSLELYKSYNIDIISIFQKTTLHKECNNCSFKKKLQSGQMKTFNCTNMVYYIHGKQY